MSELKRQAVRVVLHTTVLLQEIENLEKLGANNLWTKAIKFTGNKFLKCLINFTAHTTEFYSDKFADNFYKAISEVENFGNILSVETIAEINEYLENKKDEGEV